MDLHRGVEVGPEGAVHGVDVAVGGVISVAQETGEEVPCEPLQHGARRTPRGAVADHQRDHGSQALTQATMPLPEPHLQTERAQNQVHVRLGLHLGHQLSEQRLVDVRERDLPDRVTLASGEHRVDEPGRNPPQARKVQPRDQLRGERSRKRRPGVVERVERRADQPIVWLVGVVGRHAPPLSTRRAWSCSSKPSQTSARPTPSGQRQRAKRLARFRVPAVSTPANMPLPARRITGFLAGTP